MTLPVVPTLLIPVIILISLKVLQGPGSTVCVSGVSRCCQIKVRLSWGGCYIFLYICARTDVNFVFSRGDCDYFGTRISDLGLFGRCCATSVYISANVFDVVLIRKYGQCSEQQLDCFDVTGAQTVSVCISDSCKGLNIW